MFFILISGKPKKFILLLTKVAWKIVIIIFKNYIRRGWYNTVEHPFDFCLVHVVVKINFGKLVNKFLPIHGPDISIMKKKNVVILNDSRLLVGLHGGFQLVDLIITELKGHMTFYQFECSRWLKIYS